MTLKKLGLTLALALLAFPPVAQAGNITFSNVLGTWSNGTPVANVSYANNGTQTPSANWGSGGVSGYDFVGVNAFGVTVPPPAGFDLGTFTHRNQPINSGSSITGIRLTVSTTVEVDSISQGVKNFVFDFIHNETPNNDNPCADGGTLGVGVNVNGCADSVKFVYNTLSDSFTVGNVEYTLNLAGFVVGSSTVSEFWTKEQADNSAVLKGVAVERSSVVPDGGSTFILLGAALAGLSAWRKRSI